MADIQIRVGGRAYALSCRDGEQNRLHMLARLIDEKAREAAQAMPGLTETRQLLFASLLLADELAENRAAAAASAQLPLAIPPSPSDPDAVLPALEAVATRVEELAEVLAARAGTP